MANFFFHTLDLEVSTKTRSKFFKEKKKIFGMKKKKRRESKFSRVNEAFGSNVTELVITLIRISLSFNRY